MRRNQSVSAHSFAMVPRADIPRSAFVMESAHKTTLNGGWLVPVYLEEMLPGDTFNVRMDMVARLITPLAPTMDNLHIDAFWFACPWRLLWDNFEKFMGAQDNPDDSTDYVMPQVKLPAEGFVSQTLPDYLGLPVGNPSDPTPINATVCRMPFDMYNLVYNEWFRDENLQDSRPVNRGDATVEWTDGDYLLMERGKRHDYFTSCLPWPQKGESVPLPLGTAAPIFGKGAAGYPQVISVMDGQPGGTTARNLQITNASAAVALSSAATSSGSLTFSATEQPLYADLTEATGSTINALRQSFQIQRLLERDARGGTRYTEMVLAHFGVRPPDFRLQRPEYLGGGSALVQIHPVAQTSATSVTGTDTPQGTLAAVGTASMRNGFVYSAQEHMYIMCLVSVRADLTYQQGLARMWSRRTRFDVYHPVFAALGEQAVLRKEIYWTGQPGEAADDYVFGYQERWAEYRYKPSQITGLFRSKPFDGTIVPPSLDLWHYSQEFESAPLLNEEFIRDPTEAVVDRSIAVTSLDGSSAQFYVDLFFRNRAARPMPLYSVPGLIDHF